MYYSTNYAFKYLDALENEISLNYKDEVLKTIYIGGGTPNSLNITELEKLFNILKILKKETNYEYTIECNIELLTLEQILLMKKYGVNRVSLGVQTLNEKYLHFLNRNHTKVMVFEKVN
jgi:oxygen-independent coproporphyrinogen-3 oxidase